MGIIEGLKKLAKENFYVTINIDGDHVQVDTGDNEWSGHIDELEDFLNDD